MALPMALVQFVLLVAPVFALALVLALVAVVVVVVVAVAAALVLNAALSWPLAAMARALTSMLDGHQSATSWATQP